MFPDETYSLSELAHKFGLPAEQLELGLRRAGARPLDDTHDDTHGHSHGHAHGHTYSYELVWRYVHTFLNHGRFAAWEHNTERVTVSEMTEALTAEVTAGWPQAARASLSRILKSANGSTEVCFMLHHILRIDPECPACGHFPWIVGYDGRQACTALVLSIYVCPGCGYLFLKR